MQKPVAADELREAASGGKAAVKPFNPVSQAYHNERVCDGSNTLLIELATIASSNAASHYSTAATRLGVLRAQPWLLLIRAINRQLLQLPGAAGHWLVAPYPLARRRLTGA